ncbi:MAG: ABC transporter permease [Longimicrobiales bacterium]
MTRRPPTPALFRLLVRMYPRAYRTRYASEMEEFFHREWAASGGGPGFWLRLVADHVEAAWHVRARRPGRGEGWTMGEDLRAAVRALRRAPAFTLFASLTLALGIGATASVYTVVDRVVLRPLPYEGAERMAVVGPRFTRSPDDVGISSPALLVALQDAPGPAEALASSAFASMILTGLDDPERVTVQRVDEGFLPMFGARPVVGRLLTAADQGDGAPGVVVLTHPQWVDRFGSDPGVVGRTIQLDDQPFEIVGVLNPGFAPPETMRGDGGLIVPLAVRTGEPARSSFFITTVARLRSGATRTDMADHMERVVAGIYPPGDGPAFLAGGGAADLRAEVVGDVGSTLGRMLAAVALLLLIACVNVASLLLTRSAERAREVAVRSALGASRGRLVRQFLAESAVLAVLAGTAGSGLAAGALALFRRYAPGGIPRLAEASVDVRVLLVCFATALATVVVFGLVPALRAARLGGSGVASMAGRATGGVHEGRLRGLLVALETGLAVVLVVGSGLLAHDLIRRANEDPGFRAEGLATMSLSLRGRPAAGDDASTLAYWNQVEEAMRAIPGVASVTLSSEVPYGSNNIVAIYTPEGHEQEAEGAWIPTVVVGEGYFRTFGIPFLAGRGFDAAERAGERQVAVVNQAFVDTYWPGADGTARRIKSGGPAVDDEGHYDVVGVVADIRTRPGREARPTMWVPLGQETWDRMDVTVRTSGDAAALAPALREAVRRVDPGVPVGTVTTVEALSRGSLTRPRFYTTLFGGFAVVALLLSVVGVYGTTAYAARARTREIGIRLALGAGRASVVAEVARRTGAVVLLGVVGGLAVAALASRVLADVLLQVGPRDPLTFGLVGTVVLAAGVLAAWVPAHRAGGVDPARTLRDDA